MALRDVGKAVIVISFRTGSEYERMRCSEPGQHSARNCSRPETFYSGVQCVSESRNLAYFCRMMTNAAGFVHVH